MLATTDISSQYPDHAALTRPYTHHFIFLGNNPQPLPTTVHTWVLIHAQLFKNKVTAPPVIVNLHICAKEDSG